MVFNKTNWPFKLNFIIRSDSNHPEHECDSWSSNITRMTPEVKYFHEGQVKLNQYWYLSAICVQNFNCPITIIQGRPTTNPLSTTDRSTRKFNVYYLVFWPSNIVKLHIQYMSIYYWSRTQNIMILVWSWKKNSYQSKTQTVNPCQGKHTYN